MKTLVLKQFCELTKEEKEKAITQFIDSNDWADVVANEVSFLVDEKYRDAKEFWDYSILEGFCDFGKIKMRDHYSSYYISQAVYVDIYSLDLSCLSPEAQEYFRQCDGDPYIEIDLYFEACSGKTQIKFNYWDLYLEDEIYDADKAVNEHFYKELERLIEASWRGVCDLLGDYDDLYLYYIRDTDFCEAYLVNNDVYFDEKLNVYY